MGFLVSNLKTATRGVIRRILRTSNEDTSFCLLVKAVHEAWLTTEFAIGMAHCLMKFACKLGKDL